MMRAAGEALAVQMVIGNRPVMPTGLTEPLTTLTSQITLDMGNTVFGRGLERGALDDGPGAAALSLPFVALVRPPDRARRRDQ